MLKQFRAIAATTGNKSQDKKRGMITKLLAASKAQEAGYIMRALQVPHVAPTAHLRITAIVLCLVVSRVWQLFLPRSLLALVG